MKVKRKIIKIDNELCDGCGNCVPACAEGAIVVVDGKAKVVSEKYCDGLGVCIGECPMGALQIIEREAEEFDETAVMEHLGQLRKKETVEAEGRPCGDPSSQIETFSSEDSVTHIHSDQNTEPQPSALTHWPIQIRLVPPHASFLNGANLLVVSDCTPCTYPNFHRDFIKGRAVLIGCPKFDQQELYREKFAEIFKYCNIRSVTVVIMEVPCCGGMPMIVKSGMKEAGMKVPMEVITLSIRGEIIKRENEAA